jgi:hypothetical protein
MTFIKEGDVKSEPIEGRIHDVILYCFLLLGLIREKQECEVPTLGPNSLSMDEAEFKRRGL